MNPPPGARDGEWAGDARAAVGIALGFPMLLMGVDTAAGTLNALRALLWAGLGLVLFTVLWPTMVSADPGLLTARGLIRRHQVHTDRLASVTWHNGIAQRLLLEDTDGNRAEVDPRVFAANPALWHVLDRDIRTSLSRGTLHGGRQALRQLSRVIERETSHTVFKVSGLG
ncbi:MULTISPECIES: hypothetical protein [unclassified Streptomyces]|uniref:hypothetical protein n=1 Tax=unclassified Streptomyces TaxID=2593676 RepID=UPI0020300756|nr:MULTISPECIES: hypothetical protein [unclassified Streptomyces]MCM1973036.1 hypothetical protein [Streptomyces sp. G1]MCX5126966.1 hypothetical protein [Streptomyces sp. NBC_00347]